MITSELYKAECYIDKAINICKDLGAKETARELIDSRNRIREMIDTIELERREKDD